MIKQFLKSAIGGLFLLLLLSGCNQIPMRNPFAGSGEPKLGQLPLISATQKEVSLAWSSNVLSKQEKFSKLIPFATPGSVYAADHSGKVVALSSQNGKKIWINNTGKKFTAGPILMDRTLLLATLDAKIVAIDAITGQLEWESKVSSEVLAPPTGKNGVVLVNVIDGTVTALDGKTGQKLWSMTQTTPSLTLRYSSAPVIIGDTVLAGMASGKLIALNLHSGLIEWERVISLARGRSELQRMVDISADPIVMDNVVYVITYQGKLAAVNITSGDLIWEREVSSYQNIAMDNNHLYITDNSHHLWALNIHTGETVWKQSSLAERYITGPCVIDGNIVVGDRGGYLHVLAANNGKLVGRYKGKGKFYQNPVLFGKSILASSRNGKIAALRVKSQRSV